MHPDAVPDPDPDAPAQRARTRRQAVLLLVVVNALVLGTGLVAAVDLRRLGTPGGTALRWVEAAVFGDCGDYLAYSVAAGDVPDERTDDMLCRDLRTATVTARSESLRIGLRLGAVVQQGGQATAEVVLTRDRTTLPLHLRLVRRQGRWRVVRDAAACQVVGCA